MDSYIEFISETRQDFPSDLIMCFSGVHAWLSLSALKCVGRQVSAKRLLAIPLLSNALNKKEGFIVLPKLCLNFRNH